MRWLNTGLCDNPPRTRRRTAPSRNDGAADATRPRWGGRWPARGPSLRGPTPGRLRRVYDLVSVGYVLVGVGDGVVGEGDGLVGVGVAQGSTQNTLCFPAPGAPIRSMVSFTWKPCCG